GRWRFARAADIGGRFLVVGKVRAAKEVLFVEVALAQESGGSCDVDGLTAVRRAGDRDFLASQVVFLFAAVFEKRQSLEGLGGRANARHECRMPREREKASERIDDRDRSAMTRFEMAAAIDVRERERHFGG